MKDTKDSLGKKKRNLMLKMDAVKWSALKLYIQVTFYRLSRLYVCMFRNAYTQRHTLPPPPAPTTIQRKGCEFEREWYKKGLGGREGKMITQIKEKLIHTTNSEGNVKNSPEAKTIA